MQGNGGISVDNRFYNIKNVSFRDRESFNNAILLLTMIKSDYYYIVGFSRVKGVITVGFDFESEYHGVITEFITVDFNSSDRNVEIRGELQNISKSDIVNSLNKNSDKFCFENNKIIYLSRIEKDASLPLGMKEINDSVLSSKNEIIEYLEEQYKRYFNQNHTST